MAKNKFGGRMKKLMLIVLFVLFAQPSFAQSDKWQRDVLQILVEIEDRQKEILKRIDRLEEAQAGIDEGLKALKKGQRSYVNPKWAP